MRILLVRHGESQANIDPSIYQEVADHAVPLSPNGWEQSRRAGERIDAYFSSLSEHPEKLRIWTSPYRRTRETAQAIAERIEFAPVDIREHINLCEQQFGLFDGIPDEDLRARFPEEWDHYEKCVRHEGKFWARMPLGESRFDVAIRVHQAFGTFQRDAERHGLRNIVVVCHGVTLRAFVMQWLHLTPEWFEAESNPENCAIRVIEDGKDLGYL